MLEGTQKKMQSTNLDGTNRDLYVSYYELNQQNATGLSIPLNPLQTTTIAQGANLDYTVMLWFKPLGDQWNSQLQYALQFASSLSCYFSEIQTLICESPQSSTKMSISTANVYQNVWSHLTISGQASSSSYALLESRTDLINSVSAPYIALQYSKTVCLGACNDQAGFQGGIRDFVFALQYISQSQARKIKNHYLTWDYNIIAYYRFSEKLGLRDEFKQSSAVSTTSSKPKLSKDFISNDICYPFQDFEESLHFVSDNTFQPLTIGSRWNPLYTNYAYSMSVWLNIDSTHCTAAQAADAIRSCSIIHFREVFMIYFDTANTIRIQFFALQDYYQTSSPPIFVPLGQWINVQFTMSQFNGYQIQIYDIQGRLLNEMKKVYNLQEQRPQQKVIEFFTNYRGYAKNLVLLSKSVNLPYFPPAYIKDNDFMFYLKFTREYLTTTALQNLGDNKDGVTQNVLFTNIKNVQFGYVNFYDYTKSGKSSNGLLTSTTQLFDGIACKDQQYTLQLNSNSSYVKGKTINVTDIVTSATVELWIRPSTFANLHGVIQLYSNKSQHQYFDIYLTTSNQVICAPFGIDSLQSPYVTYSDLNTQNVNQNSWFHIACSFTQQDQINGYLYSSSSFDHTYTTALDQNTDFLPNDIYTIYIGNRRSLIEGSTQMLIKEVRIWQSARSQDDIAYWRQRQVNPLQQDQVMLAYFRMAEAFYSEYDFNSIETKNVSYASINDIAYIKNTELVICPLETYLFNGTCYNQPFKLFVLTVFPLTTDDGQFWNFTIKNSEILDKQLFQNIKTFWKSTNAVVQKLIQDQQGSLDIVIPTTACANQQPFTISVNVSNSYYTFELTQSLQFLPVSCQYVVVDDSSDANSAYNLYNQPASTNDITFNLQLQTKDGGCNTFYNQFVPQITYMLSPMPKVLPTLNVQQTSDTQLAVTIPRDQQGYFPMQQDVQIIMQVYWTNSDYKTFIDTQASTFQHVVYTVNFNYKSSTVMPILEASSNFALKGQDITLDASQSYITEETGSSRYDGLTYSWICPDQILSLCNAQTNNKLSISYQNFASAGGAFNTSYTFTVVINWNTQAGNSFEYYASETVIWYDVTDPAFTIISSNTNILATQENVFTLNFANYQSQSTSNLKISWSITPSVAKPQYTLSNDSLQLTVVANGFKQNTLYTIAVNVSDTQYSIANRYSQIVQSTLFPPSSGSAGITPSTGLVNDTQFTIYLSTWQSVAPPVVYQVWQAASASGTTLDNQLTDTWTTTDSNFTFTAQSTNPIYLLLTDSTYEITQYGPLKVTISQPKAVNMTAKALLLQKKITQSTSDIENKYELLLQLATEVVPKLTDTKLIASNVQFILDSIETDTDKIDSKVYVNRGYSKIVLDKAAEVFSSQIFSQGLNNTKQARQLSTISKQLSNSTSFTSQVKTSLQFAHNYAGSLSSVFRSKQVTRGRLLQSVENGDDMYQVTNEQVKQLANAVCLNLTQAKTQQVIETDSFSIQLQWANAYSDAQQLKQQMKNYTQYSTVVNFNDLLDDLRYISNVDSSSLCIQSIFYTSNPYTSSLNQQSQQLYSTVSTQFDIVDADLQSVQNVIDLKLYIQTNFAINIAEDLNNQTICVEYKPELYQWQSEFCLTTVDPVEEQINCFCSIAQNSLTTIITDTSRDQGNTLYYKYVQSNNTESSSSINIINSTATPQNTTTQSQTQSITYETNYMIISVILLLICLGIVVPVIGYLLDRKDFNYAMEKLDASIKTQLLLKVVQISQEPLSYWKFKKDTVLSYNLQSSSLFSHLVQQIHPLFSLFTKYDVFESRNTRFFTYYLQISLYALICVLTFGPYYREERNLTSIDTNDIKSILIVCMIGQILLLPLPFSLNQISQKLYKQNQSKTNSQDQIEDNQIIKKQQDSQVQQQLKNNVSSRSNAYNLPQLTQEQNILNQSSPNMKQNKNKSPTKQLQQYEQQQDMVFQPQCNLLKIVLISLSYLLALVSIIIACIYSKKQSSNTSTNQQCIVLTFFLGLFASIFITNMVRIGVNALFAGSKSTNKKVKNLLISAQSERIYKEIQFVRQADKELFQQYDTQGSHRNERDSLLEYSNKNQVQDEIQEKDMNKFNEDDLKDIILFDNEEDEQNEQSNQLRISQRNNQAVNSDQSDVMEEQISYKTKDQIIADNNIVKMDEQDNSFRQRKDDSPSNKIYGGNSNSKKLRRSQERTLEAGSGLKTQQIKYQCVTEKGQEFNELE